MVYFELNLLKTIILINLVSVLSVWVVHTTPLSDGDNEQQPIKSHNDNSNKLLNTLAIQEYDIGQTAVLKCESRDRDHNFMFWEFLDGNDLIIGPGTKYDSNKYKIDVLTGKLSIKNVTPQERGIYKCFSRAVGDSDYFIKKVELVVERKWNEVYEDNTDLNLLRALLGTTILLILLGVGYVIFKLNSRRIPHIYLESSDDESVEDVFTAPEPSTSKNRNSNIVLNQNKPNVNGSSNQPVIETDFHSVFTAINSHVK